MCNPCWVGDWILGVGMLSRTVDCMLWIVIGENFIGISNCANCSTGSDYVYCVMMKLSKSEGHQAGRGGRGQSECGKLDHPPTQPFLRCVSKVLVFKEIWMWGNILLFGTSYQLDPCSCQNMYTYRKCIFFWLKPNVDWWTLWGGWEEWEGR